MKEKLTDEQNIIFGMLNANPDYYYGYKLAGDYYSIFGNNKKALSFYQMSLTKEYENTILKEEVLSLIEKLEKESAMEKK